MGDQDTETDNEVTRSSERRRNYARLKAQSRVASADSPDSANTDSGQDEEEGKENSTQVRATVEAVKKLTSNPESIDDETIREATRDVIHPPNPFGDSMWADWKLRQLLKARPDLGEAALKEAKIGAASSDEVTRAGAMCAVEAIISSRPDLAPECLEMVKIAAKDTTGRVRYSAQSALERIVQASRSDLWLDTATDLVNAAVKDPDEMVRGAAMYTLGSMTLQRPDLGPKTLEMAKTGAADADWWVREKAQTALYFIAIARPDLKVWEMDDVIGLVDKGARDFKEDGSQFVREKAMSNISCIVDAHPEVADRFVDAVKAATKDPYVYTRPEAMEALRTIVDKRPDLMDADIRNIANDALSDSEEYVRDLGRDILKEQKAIGAPQSDSAVKKTSAPARSFVFAP